MQCRLLEATLRQKKIKFETEDDLEKVIEFAERHQIMSAPILETDEGILDYARALTWAREHK